MIETVGIKRVCAIKLEDRDRGWWGRLTEMRIETEIDVMRIDEKEPIEAGMRGRIGIRIGTRIGIGR